MEALVLKLSAIWRDSSSWGRETAFISPRRHKRSVSESASKNICTTEILLINNTGVTHVLAFLFDFL